MRTFKIYSLAAAAAKSLQSWPTLCNPIDGRSPGSPIPGILQARILEWVAISSSNAWKWKVKVKSLSLARLVATPCAAHQAALSMGFSRQEYYSLSNFQIHKTILLTIDNMLRGDLLYIAFIMLFNIYWVGQKVCWGFGKTQMKFLANPACPNMWLV